MGLGFSFPVSFVSAVGKAGCGNSLTGSNPASTRLLTKDTFPGTWVIIGCSPVRWVINTWNPSNNYRDPNQSFQELSLIHRFNHQYYLSLGHQVVQLF